MSERMIKFHWAKHHKAYVDKLNKQVAGTELEEKPLEDVVQITYNAGVPRAAFNNAAQVCTFDFEIHRTRYITEIWMYNMVAFWLNYRLGTMNSSGSR